MFFPVPKLVMGDRYAGIAYSALFPVAAVMALFLLLRGDVLNIGKFGNGFFRW